MKVVMVSLLVLVLSSFVIAQSSETSAEFNIGVVDVGKDYVPLPSFWELYSNYVIGAVIALIVLAILLRKKKLARSSASSRKKAKVSKKKVSKKKSGKKKK